MRFDNHITYVVNRSNKLLGLIKRTFMSLDKDSFLTLYNSWVKPIIDYGGSVYFQKNRKHMQLLENIQIFLNYIIEESATI